MAGRQADDAGLVWAEAKAAELREEQYQQEPDECRGCEQPAEACGLLAACPLACQAARRLDAMRNTAAELAPESPSGYRQADCDGCGFGDLDVCGHLSRCPVDRRGQYEEAEGYNQAEQAWQAQVDKDAAAFETQMDHDAEGDIIRAIFGGGPVRTHPRGPENTAQVFREWREATEAAVEGLREWLDALREWETRAGNVPVEDFRRQYRRMVDAGLDGWADDCQAGGGIDWLSETVTGQEP